MNFGEALQALKDGKKAAREGWNGKGMWIRLVDLYLDKEFSVREHAGSTGTWMPFIVLKTPDNKLLPWNASQADALADDWAVVP